MTDTRIGICLVGTGRIGRVHFKNICSNPRVRLLYVIDVDLVTAKELAGAQPGCKVMETIDEALKDPLVKGVVICVPTAGHPKLILQSLRAGKGVMCEKPISLSIKEIDECYTEAKKLSLPLFCGYQRRSDPSFVKLKESCAQGDIGTVQIVKTMSRDFPVPSIAYLKISGGIFHDCGSHDIDLVRWITGENPYEVFAYASAFNKEIEAINDYDTVMISLKFPSGVLGSIDLSRKAAYGYDQRIEVLGDLGMVQSMNRQPTSTIISTGKGVVSDTNCYSFPQRYEHAYANEMDHFADILLGKCQPKLSHEDARAVSIIADAAEESARTGKPVKIQY